MTINLLTPIEKKLKTVRKILWLCFGGISIPIIVSIGLLLLVLGLQNSAFIVAGPDGSPMSMLPFLILSPFLLIGMIGVVFLVVYYILKYRLEKNDELFL